MKKIFILQNSNLSFGLDAGLIYQPDKYDLHLIVNEFGYNSAKSRDQFKYYKYVFLNEDFSVTTITKYIKEIIDDGSSFNIITNSEETMPVCGEVRVLLGLDDKDYSRFYDKDVMKQVLIDTNAIKLPKYNVFNSKQFHDEGIAYLANLVKKLIYPLFIKPIALYGSVNLTKVHSFEDLTIWANKTNNDVTYEIDEFIDGTMYHCDSFIKDKQVLFTFVSQNSRPCYNFTVGEMKGTIVLPREHPDSLLLSDIAEHVLRDLGMPDGGVTHMEVIKTPDNQVYFIEIAHRSPGILIPQMYKTHAGIDTIASHYLLQIDPEYTPKPDPQKYAAWACYPKAPGSIVKLKEPSSTLSSTVELEWKYAVGDEFTTYSQYGRDYTGTIFLTNPDFENLYSDFVAVNDDNLCVIEFNEAQ